MTKNVVIVGAGHAAGQAVATLRQKKYDGGIVVLGDEDHLPYQRPPLSKKFLAGEMPAARLYLKPPTFYDEQDIELHLGAAVTRIDPAAAHVVDSAGNVYPYEKLIIATGARVRRLDCAGADLPGIHYLRNIQDVSAMQSKMCAGNKLVIIGAGYIGLEVAAVAASKGLNVTVIEMADRVMSRVVAAEVSEFYQNEHRARGVDIQLSTGLDGFSGDEHVEFVHLSDGRSVSANFVLVGIGVVPNVELAIDASVAVDNGIQVDDHCRTNIEGIYAIGDCTNHPNSLLGRRLRLESVQNALEQAKTAASNICGHVTSYAEVPWFWSDQYDLKLQIAGISEADDNTILRGNPESRAFSCVYLRNDRIVAINSINSPRDFMQSKQLIASQARMDIAALGNVDVMLKDAARADNRVSA